MPLARADLKSSNTPVSQWLLGRWGWWCIRILFVWESSTTTLNHQFTMKAALGLHRWAQTTRAVEVQELPGIYNSTWHFLGDEVDDEWVYVCVVCQVFQQKPGNVKYLPALMAVASLGFGVWFWESQSWASSQQALPDTVVNYCTLHTAPTNRCAWKEKNTSPFRVCSHQSGRPTDTARLLSG